MVLVGAFALRFTISIGPVNCETRPSSTIKNVEIALKEAQDRESEFSRHAAAAEADLDRLIHRSIAIAAKIQVHESNLLNLEDELSALKERQHHAATALEKRRQQLSSMLVALQRISMHPPIVLLAQPRDPMDTIRSALLLRNTVPALQSMGQKLRRDLDTIREFTHAIAVARKNISREGIALKQQQNALTKLLSKKKLLATKSRHTHAKLQVRTAMLTKEVRTLRDLVTRLEINGTRKQQRKSLPQLPTSIQLNGLFPNSPIANTIAIPGRVIEVPVLAANGLPVRGHIGRRFGENLKNGESAKGVSLKTRPGSTVIAPRDGIIVFAGPFRGLGELLIIQYQDKYHLLLAGMERIDKQVGESVLAGEPVGVMTTSKRAETALYMELRRNGRPINPLPWLAAATTKVNG